MVNIETGLLATSVTFHILDKIESRFFVGHKFTIENGKYLFEQSYGLTPEESRAMLARYAKKLAHGEVGPGGWYRINNAELDTFGHGVRVSDVYCLYDALLGRKNRSEDCVSSKIRAN